MVTLLACVDLQDCEHQQAKIVSIPIFPLCHSVMWKRYLSSDGLENNTS